MTDAASTVTTSTPHGAHWGAAPTFIEDDVPANEKSLKQFGNMVSDRLAQLQAQRAEWREFLVALYASEAEQDDAMRALKKQVLMGEAEALANPGFHRWMREREQHGVGTERLASWYHEDTLLALTPYLAAVPFPRQLTDAGWAEVESVVDELMGDAGIRSARLEWCALRRSSTLGPSAATPAGSAAITGGASVRTAYDTTDGSLRAALADTPCIFLCDGADPSCDIGVSTLRLFVARGSCVACEPYDAVGRGLCIPDTQDLRPEMPANSGAHLTAASCGLLSQLQAWVTEELGAALPNRSYAAAVRCHCRRNTISGAVTVSFYLLNLEPLDAVDTAAFAWSDLVGLILPAEMRRAQRTAALAAAAATAGTASATEGGEDPSVEPPAPPPAAPPAPPVQFRGAWHLVDAATVGNGRPPGAVIREALNAAAVAPEISAAVAPSSMNPTGPSSGNNNQQQQMVILAAAAATACALSVVVGIAIGRRSADHGHMAQSHHTHV